MMKNQLILIGVGLISVLILGEFFTYVWLVATNRIPVSDLTTLFAQGDKYLIAGGASILTTLGHAAVKAATPNPIAPFDPAGDPQ